MGLDFTALLEYESFAKSAVPVIDRLETDKVLPEFEKLWAIAKSKGQHDWVFGVPFAWITTVDYQDGNTPTRRDEKQRERPELPSRDWRLSTSATFQLTFGPRLVSIYHPLRWNIFVRDPQWQQEMLAAIGVFARWFGATDGVICHDCSAVVTYELEPSLARAIERAKTEWNEFEAEDFDSTWRDEEFKGFVRFAGLGNE